MGKDQNIETLRGMALIALVAFHVIGDTASTGLRVSDDSSWRWFADSFGFIRMPLFTFLSGLVYAAYAPMRGSVLRFLTSKARRLLFPMITVGFAFLLLQNIAPGTNRDLLAERSWYIWFVLPIAHFWFLPALFWIFVLFALLDVRGKLESSNSLSALLLFSIVVSVIIGPMFSRNWLGVEGALYLLPFFTTGVAVARLNWRDKSIHWKLLAVMAVALSFAWIQLGVSGVIPAMGVRHDIVGIVASLAALMAISAFNIQNKALSRLGYYAYPVFLFHVFGSGASRIALGKAGIDNSNVQFVAGLALALVVGIVMAKVFSRFEITNVIVLGNKPRNTLRAEFKSV